MSILSYIYLITYFYYKIGNGCNFKFTEMFHCLCAVLMFTFLCLKDISSISIFLLIVSGLLITILI